MLLALSLSKCVSLQFGSNSFYQKLLNETRLRKPAPPLLASLATPQKNTLCSFHFARAGFLFLLMKRVFFCGVLPSKYSGRWRDWPHFYLSKEKRNSPQAPLPLFLCSNGTGTEAGGQKFLPPTPLPFCPPAWASSPKLLSGRIFRRTSFPCPTTRARKRLRNSPKIRLQNCLNYVSL